ncbi:hypothetical protein [Allomesorhizobium camelthorni]|uniref:Trypsin-like peptidase domain-containing protein n=1 Tax=Allomesorhizobium camelthorni TaxID=475069 RepID=A0A6G4W6N6_9HYPH|nr:hypothetical protein [Mesorhizobium camelthorni]NGO50402.1 hypothetical protein [Mesorhizobium camelthorni]
MRINEAIRKTVVFLGIQDNTGAFTPYGTGFVALWPEHDRYYIYLVTAKHVLSDIKRTSRDLIGRLNSKEGKAELGKLPAPDEWFTHPSNSQCDIAVVPFSASPETFDYKGVDLIKNILTEDFIRENEVGPGDMVFTAGLLTRHFGVSKNIPIVRSGNIAAMPDEPIDLVDLGHQEVYLIESRSIGGLSGSPVFLSSSAARVRGGTLVLDPMKQERLIGVNIGLFQLQPSIDRARTDEAERRDHFLEMMSAGIAIVVPIQRAIEIIRDRPDMIEHRYKQYRSGEMT